MMAKKTKQQPATKAFYSTTEIRISKSHPEYRRDGSFSHVEMDAPLLIQPGTELHFIRDEFFPFIGWTKVFKVADQAQWLRLSADQVSETPVTLEVQV